MRNHGRSWRHTTATEQPDPREESPINVPERRDGGSPPDVEIPFLPVQVTQHVVEPRWWEVWKRPSQRDFSEQYRPPRWWQRLFSLISLSVISLTAGVMAAVAIAAAVAAVAIALQSLVS